MSSRRAITILAFLLAASSGTAPAQDVADEQGHHDLTRSDRFTSTPATPTPAIAPRALGAEWSPLGPFGGTVRDVAVSPVNPDLAIAGHAVELSREGRIYVSTDGGVTWSRAPDVDRAIHAIELAADGTVYAGGATGAWQSTDGGASWSPLDLGLGANDQVFDLALAPSDQDTLWACVQPVGSNMSILRSTDGGTTWEDRTPPGAGDEPCSGIAVDPADAGTVIAAYWSGTTAWVTTDGGTTWLDRSAGLPGGLPLNDVHYDGSRLLIGGGQLFGSQNVGLYQSNDLGATWTALHDNTWPLLVVESIAVDPADPQVILAGTRGAGLNRTTDGGATWEVGIGDSAGISVQSVRFAPGSSSKLLIGASQLAVYASEDGGTTLEWSSDGISELSLYAIDVSPADPQEMAVAFQGVNDGGMYSSTDGGVTWTLESAPAVRWGTVRFAPDGTLHAISNGPTGSHQEAIWRREADGSWVHLGPNQGSSYDTDLFSLYFGRANPDLMLAGGRDRGSANGNEGTIWLSSDAGATWTKVYEGDDFTPTVDFEIVDNGLDQTMLAAQTQLFSGDPRGVLLRSNDGGASWASSETGLNPEILDGRLCAAPDDADVFYFSATTGPGVGRLFRTDDAGASWAATGWEGSEIVDLACDPVDSNLLYIAQVGADPVARSEDQGVGFQPLGTGLENLVQANGLAYAGGAAPRLLVAGFMGSHAFALPASSGPTLVFSPLELDFGDVPVGETSGALTATLENVGDADTTSLALTVPGSGFEADTSACGPTLPPGGNCEVGVTFTPADVGSVEASLEASGDGDVAAALSLAGNGVSEVPIAGISPGSLDFEVEEGESGDQILNVGNVGTADLVWGIEEMETVVAPRPTERGATRRSGAGRAVDDRRASVSDASAPTAGHELPPASDRARRLDDYGHRPETAAIAASSPTGERRRTGAAAAGAAWSLLGPPGGDVFAIAASPTDADLVLAGIAPNGISGGTLYRSTDGGDTWSESSEPGISVLDIEFAADGTAYLGTADGVWTSPDNGLTWSQLDLDIGVNDFVEDVELDSSNPSNLWAGVADALGNQPINVVRSTDGGATWSDATPPLPSPMACRGLAVDPTDSDTVIAAFGGGISGGSVWVTTDGGASWTDRSAGLPPNLMRDVDYDGTRLLVGGGQLFGSQDVGLYSSTDLGASWTALHDSSWPRLVAIAVAVDPADPQTILVASDGHGVHRTTDGGATWEIGAGATEGLSGRALRFAPGSSTNLYLGTSSLAAFRSTDGGDSFVSASQGIAEFDLYSIDANPLNAEEIAVAFQGQNDGGVVSSLDGGVTWSVEPVPATRYDTVRFAPDGALYALSTGPTTVAQEGLYRRDGDGTWTLLGPDQGDLFESELTAVRFSVNEPDLILVGGKDFGSAQGNEGTIWLTTDGGATWSKVYEGGANQPVTDIDIVEDGNDQVMIASYNDLSGGQVGGVVRSEDGGVVWSPSGSGLPTDFLRDPRLCAAAGNPQVFFLSVFRSFGSGELFRTDDGGASWSSTGWTADTVIRDVACHPGNAQVLYISQGGDTQQVARSDDGGVTFTPYASGLEEVSVARSLAFADSTRLLLVTRGGSYVTDLDDPVACPGPDDIPWLSLSPTSGTTAPDDSTPVNVAVDATGLAAGEYTSRLCVATNDPSAPLVLVPITLTVVPGPAPLLDFAPAGLDFGDVVLGTTSAALTATLTNSGDAEATGLSFELPGDGFDADTSGCGGDLPVGASCEVSVTFTPVEPGPATAVLTATSAEDAAAALDLAANGAVVEAYTPTALAVDLEERVSDGNRLLEPHELVEVAPSWRNDGTLAQSLTGTASAFEGPEGAVYTLEQETADYGLLDAGAEGSCLDVGVCYVLGVDDPAVRPATHWEAVFTETLSDSEQTARLWTLHVGESFTDVPKESLFYHSIETLLHSGVTGGCGGTEYCPAGSNTRGQMAVFLLRAAEGSDYQPTACEEDAERFDDVPASSPLCRWIEELAARGVTSGCGNGSNYCPGDSVTRSQMAVFLLKALEGAGYTPPPCSSVFTDVPCSSPFAPWVEELATREITGGCSATEYCPATPVSRQQMAAFVVKTFGLTLYGP